MADQTLARRASPIHGYVGPNGSGKSLALVTDTIPSLRAGRRVLSTVRLLDPDTGETHPNYEKLTDWSQLLEAEHADILFDEVVGIASSRDSAGLPTAVANLLVQLRRRDLVLRWSAPAWARADKIIRECSQAVTECRGYWADRSAQKLAAQEGREIPAWAPKRLFRWRTFAAVDFEDWTAGKRDRLSPDVRQWFWGPGCEAFKTYDTLDAVSRIGEVLESGRCAHCGGRRTAPECSCPDYQERKPKRLTARERAEQASELAAGHVHEHHLDSAPAAPAAEVADAFAAIVAGDSSAAAQLTFPRRRDVRQR